MGFVVRKISSYWIMKTNLLAHLWRAFFCVLVVGLQSLLSAEIEVHNASGTTLTAGTLVDLGTFSTIPASGSYNWSLYNSGSSAVKIESCDVGTSSNVTYGNGVENSGISISEGQVVGESVELASKKSRTITIRFRESVEAIYRKSLNITYTASEDGVKVPERKSSEILMRAIIELPPRTGRRRTGR